MTPPHVSFVTNKIFISEVAGEMMMILKKMGAYQIPEHPEPKTWFIDFDYRNENEKTNVFKQLREIGLPFAGGAGAGWYPAEQFEDLRDKGLVSGMYKRIYWRAPNDYVIEEA